MAEASLSQLLGDLIRDLGELVRQELRLAQAEAAEKIRKAENGVYAVITGLLLAFCALLVLVQALVLALGNVMPPWLAAVCVGLALALLAFLFIRQGRSNLAPKNLVPRRTLRTVGGDTHSMKETSQ